MEKMSKTLSIENGRIVTVKSFSYTIGNMKVS